MRRYVGLAFLMAVFLIILYKSRFRMIALAVLGVLLKKQLDEVVDFSRIKDWLLKADVKAMSLLND